MPSTENPPRPGPAGPARCSHCDRPLTALQHRGAGHCGAAACRRASALAQAAQARDADIASRRRAAARAGAPAALARAPVLWLQPHATRLVPVRAAERAAQLRHLQALLSGPEEPPAPPPRDAAPASDPSTQPGRTCAFCRGRCCHHGAFTHAFVDRPLLQRWVESHPGRTLADAAAAYAALLPREHVQGSCLHHGRAGCTLPREMRSDICNRHACDGLLAVRAQVATAAQQGLVVAMATSGRVERAVFIDETQSLPLPRRPRAKAQNTA